jgi:hypothetical protein
MEQLLRLEKPIDSKGDAGAAPVIRAPLSDFENNRFVSLLSRLVQVSR